MDATAALLRLLYQRDYRRTFCEPSLWLAPAAQEARVADLEVRNSDLEGRLKAAEAENARLRGGPAPGAQAVAEAPALAVKLRRRARG